MTEKDFLYEVLFYLVGIVVSGILATIHSMQNKKYRYKDRFKFYISVIWLSWMTAFLLSVIIYLDYKKVKNLL